MGPVYTVPGVPTDAAPSDLSPTSWEVPPSTNSIESLNYQLRKISKNRGQFPSDAAAVKLLWLAICNIEDKRARQRAKEKGLPAGKRRAAGRLVEGAITTNWKQALQQLALAYPERINPHL
ncbi:transposase [Actinomyces oricola]